ncbi:uncharacterized protein TRIADDRAFT_57212 [Trichoplax adhaerens]|uniref:Coiled-coil domain-containing protein 170 n=1 Tax=Trichoplax adhaerens TaxID=10228 RepID=B3RYT9_TRIAD|nr:hypothetical protein TRIADDRAFT_57212 [Trichoplax adhaerens]EDV24084.1 hypothetical protein TRIADDRAFT_57212 [Trichoplax adhaerens]|eukprot:XP_002113610.1 hypothetical protein TRIADDRAFT_57212 [Trichoplax adhaerens]
MDKYSYDTGRISATGRPRIRSPRLSPSRSSRLSSSYHSPRGASSSILDTSEIDDIIDKPYKKYKSPLHRSSLNESLDELEAYRKELELKDRTIVRLREENDDLKKKLREIHKHEKRQYLEGMKVGDELDRIASERGYMEDKVSAMQRSCKAVQEDLANERVKLSKVTNENDELKNKLLLAEGRIGELKDRIALTNDESGRHEALNRSLRSKLREFEDKSKSTEDWKTKYELSHDQSQEQLHVQREQIKDLEDRLHAQTSNCAKYQRKIDKLEVSLQEIGKRASRYLGIDSSSLLACSAEDIAVRIEEVLQERDLYHEKADVLSRSIESMDLESKASRETIMRLVSEVGREQKTSSKINHRLEEFESRYSSLSLIKDGLELESKQLKDRLEAASTALRAAERELEKKDARIASLDAALRANDLSRGQVLGLRKEIYRLLGDDVIDDEDEDIVREKLRAILKKYRELSEYSEELEEKVKTLSDQLEKQCELQHSALQRAAEAEDQLKDYGDRMGNLESELLATDTVKSTLKDEKVKYRNFCRKLASVINLSEFTEEVAFDDEDALLSRVEQLVNKELLSLGDRKVTLQNQLRKIKTLKQQLESKELQIDIMKKKLSTVREKASGQQHIEAEKEHTMERLRDSHGENRRLKRQIQDQKQIILELKSRLLSSSDLKSKVVEQSKTILDLETTIDRLSKAKARATKKFSSLKNEIDLQGTFHKDDKELTEGIAAQLQKDLRKIKQEMEIMRARENQLLEFRQTLARLLGLEVSTLPIPDYEIIARIEQLLKQTNTYNARNLSWNTALSNAYRAGQRAQTPY